jgi:hypothetical protein
VTESARSVRQCDRQRLLRPPSSCFGNATMRARKLFFQAIRVFHTLSRDRLGRSVEPSDASRPPRPVVAAGLAAPSVVRGWAAHARVGRVRPKGTSGRSPAAAALASWRQRRRPCSLPSGSRASRGRPYAADATGPEGRRFCCSSTAGALRAGTGRSRSRDSSSTPRPAARRERRHSDAWRGALSVEMTAPAARSSACVPAGRPAALSSM